MSAKDRPPKLCSMCHEKLTVKNSTYCRECRTLYYKEWYKKHREQMLQYQKDYRKLLQSVNEEDPKTHKMLTPMQEYQRNYRAKHREHLLKLQKSWRDKNKRYPREVKETLWEVEDRVRWKSLMA